MTSPRRHVMPADVRARSWPVEIYYLDRGPSRATVLVQRALALFTLLLALVFAAAAIALIRSADPATAIVPLGVAAGMGWCAREIWPARRRPTVRLGFAPRADSGVDLVGPHGRSASERKAPAVDH